MAPPPLRTRLGAGARHCRLRVPRRRAPLLSRPRWLPWQRRSGPASGGVGLHRVQLLLGPGASCAPSSSLARSYWGRSADWGSNDFTPCALWARSNVNAYTHEHAHTFLSTRNICIGAEGAKTEDLCVPEKCAKLPLQFFLRTLLSLANQQQRSSFLFSLIG